MVKNKVKLATLTFLTLTFLASTAILNTGLAVTFRAVAVITITFTHNFKFMFC